jgi:ABC-type multidrug transport system fused ATPase/permease subunit
MGLPRTLAGYIARFSGGHQAALAALSVVVFALSAIPLELQRRIVNEVIYEGAFQPILWLALAYAGLALAEGAIKLALNVYRGWVSERAVRHLRRLALGSATARELSEAIVQQGAASAVDPAQQRRIDEVFTLHMGMFKLKFTMNFLMNLSHHLGVVAALAFGSWLVLHGRLEVGTVVAFISGLAKLNDPWGDLVNWFRDMTVNRVKYRLVGDALERMAGAASPLIDVHQDPRAPAA